MPSNKLTQKEIKGYKSFAERLAKGAGKILLVYQKVAKVVIEKDIQDIATNADLASEKYIINKISEKYPKHSIVSEEAGENDKKSIFRWIIDPLDGTKEFVRNIPLYNVSIALEYNGETIAAAIYRPFENTLFSAGKDTGAFKNGERIGVSGTTLLKNAFVYAYLPSFLRNKLDYDWSFDKLRQIGKIAYRLRGMSDENSALCWLGMGGVEVYLNLCNPPKKHDIAPGLLIAQESGAFVDTKSFPVVVANNKKIYNEVTALLKK